MNDGLAQRITVHPDRFSGFAALPLRDADAAVEEFRRCVTESGFRGAMVNGHGWALPGRGQVLAVVGGGGRARYADLSASLVVTVRPTQGV
jgi:2,3-dihydroxybenzoate decarboxylase